MSAATELPVSARRRIVAWSVCIGLVLLCILTSVLKNPFIDRRQATKANEVKLELIEIAKSGMYEPDSFELVAFEHRPPSSKSTYFQVEMRYRGIGKSGREFIKTIKAHGDYAGKVLSVQLASTKRPD